MEISKEMLKRKPKTHPMKALLKRHGINRQVVAETLGVGYSHLSNVLNGYQGTNRELEKGFDEIRQALEGGDDTNEQGGQE